MARNFSWQLKIFVAGYGYGDFVAAVIGGNWVVYDYLIFAIMKQILNISDETDGWSTAILGLFWWQVQEYARCTAQVGIS